MPRFASLFDNSDDSESDDKEKEVKGGETKADTNEDAKNPGMLAEAEGEDDHPTPTRDEKTPQKEKIVVKVKEEEYPDHTVFATLRRYSSPEIHNAIEAMGCGSCSTNKSAVTLTSGKGSMTGRAITVTMRSGGESDPVMWQDFLTYLSKMEGSKVLIVRDVAGLDAKASLFDSTTVRILKSFNITGAIIDGAVSFTNVLDVEGFPTLATCHSLQGGMKHSTPLIWGSDVNVYSSNVKFNSFVHADKHGFLTLPPPVPLSPVMKSLLAQACAAPPSIDLPTLFESLGWGIPDVELPTKNSSDSE
eukprot:TRINITY_DN12139_c0_g1_i1.p1 TRINITY_DN12139_c0_g1~~TRINITY_DN12139_c0_g1_i1.p1  ORF type:complete len:318 (+),score=67.71 TRINITY_DN12139_c0_g1_i1:43-954(+)